jgi:hypothetical protein
MTPDRLEVHLSHVRRKHPRRDGDQQAVSERGGRAESDQAVHVGAPWARASQPVRWMGAPVNNIKWVIRASCSQWSSSNAGTSRP